MCLVIKSKKKYTFSLSESSVIVQYCIVLASVDVHIRKTLVVKKMPPLSSYFVKP